LPLKRPKKDDIFEDMGFGAFGRIFKDVAGGREPSDADIMKVLNSENRARFQKEIAERIVRTKAIADARGIDLKPTSEDKQRLTEAEEEIGLKRKLQIQNEVAATAAAKQAIVDTNKNEPIPAVSLLDESSRKSDKNDTPSPPTTSTTTSAPTTGKKVKIKTPKATPPPAEVSTTVRQTAAYLTIEGIQSETSYPEEQWPCFAVKELIENSYDFLNHYYPKASKELRKISIHAKIDRAGIYRISVRNSNVNNIAVFEPLEPKFDYNNWSGTKRNQNRGTSGALGDALKRILGMGYASWTSDAETRAHQDDPTFIEYKQLQWPEPIILRFNKKEWRVYLIVEDGPNPIAKPDGPFSCEDASNYTEVEIALPSHFKPTWSDGQKAYNLFLDKIEKYYKICRLPKRNVEFSFNREVGE
jgi:hypothetical protein